MIPALLLSVSFAVPAAAPRATWSREPRDFQGIRFGGSFQDMEAALHEIGADCPDSYYTESHGEPTSCHGALDFAGARVSTGFLFEKGKLVSVQLTYNPEEWADIKAVLATRYGPPTRSSTHLFQNRMGASFKNEILEWLGQTVSLVALRYGDSLDKGAAIIGLNSYVVQAEREKKEQRKRAAEVF